MTNTTTTTGRSTTLNRVARRAEVLRVALADRDQAVREARDDGRSLREIAKAAGLSPQGVSLIVEARLCSDPFKKGCTNPARPTESGGRKRYWCRDCNREKRRLYRQRSA
jgi:hypothetical protein